MIFTDLAAGDSIFLDANTLIYHFGPHPIFGPAYRIALAHRELTANLANPARAEELLEACPPGRRGW
jgi:hypothetical protein